MSFGEPKVWWNQVAIPGELQRRERVALDARQVVDRTVAGLADCVEEVGDVPREHVPVTEAAKQVDLILLGAL